MLRIRCVPLTYKRAQCAILLSCQRFKSKNPEPPKGEEQEPEYAAALSASEEPAKGEDAPGTSPSEQQASAGAEKMASSEAEGGSAPVESGKKSDALDGDVLRWEQTYNPLDPNLEVVIDKKGNYVVSKKNWPTGEVAYKTPDEPNRLAHRFGYSVLTVKKSETYWQWYRKNPHVSIRAMIPQVSFFMLVAWILAFCAKELKREMTVQQSSAGMVGDQLGRGNPGEKTQKVEFTRDEVNQITNMAQGSYLDGNERFSLGSKDYQMKKIKRPKEFRAEDFMRKSNVTAAD